MQKKINKKEAALLVAEIRSLGEIHRVIGKQLDALGFSEDYEGYDFLAEIHNDVVTRKKRLINNYYELTGQNIKLIDFGD
jgi:hypothetical protein